MNLPVTAATPARPSVVTALPGPRSAALLARQEKRESNARTYPRHFPFAVAEASGSYIRDLDGNVFIDFLTGAGVLSLGHNHPELVAAATEQMGIFTHGLDMPTPAKDAFTEAQLSMLPPGMRDRMKIQFCGPTGANAVDAALKLCKTATGRGGIVSFQGGFHGSSHAAMAVTGNVGQKRPITNGMPGVSFFPFSSCSRCPLALDPETCQTNCVSFLERALRDPNGGLELPAAVIMEMVQGEGGVIPARKEFVQRVRRLTRELDIPLVVDEVQTGCGRTGTWFAFEAYDIEPDVIIASKALGGHGSAGGDRALRRGARHLGARRAHRHLPGQPARLRRGHQDDRDHPARRRAGQRPGPRRPDPRPADRGAGRSSRACSRSAARASCGGSSSPRPATAAPSPSWPKTCRPGPCAAG